MYGEPETASSGSSFQAKEEPAAVFDLLMDSDSGDANRNQNISGLGLLRYRSAPTSVLTDFVNGGGKICEQYEMGSSMIGAKNSQLPPQYPRKIGYSGVDPGQGRITGSSLVRQNSSPPGLFSQSGFGGARGIGNYRMSDGDLSHSSNRFKNHMNISSRMPSSLGMLSRISEVENGIGASTGIDDAKYRNNNGDDLFFSSGFAYSSHLVDSFANPLIKRDLDDEFFANNQNLDAGNRPYALSHHLSLPKSSAKMAAMEKFLQLQDAVPCKLRAKRGCATHPRSIAERVRRTKISDRMKKLQELVPNMDKQTTTADMLDFAVEYIKNLQKQYKILKDNGANCKCWASQNVVFNQTQ